MRLQVTAEDKDTELKNEKLSAPSDRSVEHFKT